MSSKMTWAATKKFFEKSFAWCVQHWRWLVFGLVALIAYLTGRKNARGLWKQAELARKQYKREAAAIEKAHADKSKKIKGTPKLRTETPNRGIAIKTAGIRPIKVLKIAVRVRAAIISRILIGAINKLVKFLLQISSKNIIL